jgi:glutaminyl-peptide cyclotransferase
VSLLQRLGKVAAVIPLALAAAAACAAAQPPATPAFDGRIALEHVRQIVDIGPRVAGTPGAQKTRDYIAAQMKALGLAVVEQAFDARTPLGTVRMVNLSVRLKGDASKGRIIIAGHYDTKLFKALRFVGANDAGSSTAFLIEAARVLKDRANPMAIELLFLDGEEAVVDWNTNDDNTYGSRYYVEAAKKDGSLATIKALILVDMIGDRDLRIMRETNSTRWLTDIVWATAKSIKRPQFVDEETAIEDDHLPFLRAGVPAVDVIDLDYPAWHTIGDTFDKLSADSLKAVGDVVIAALPAIEKRLLSQ